MAGIQGFEPYVNTDAKILILGSFPSVKSRAENFYYGNRQNKFWKILSEHYNMSVATISDKQALLANHYIALWDIVSSCEIDGSMDNSIRNYTIIDISKVFARANIERILLNGQKAYSLFLKSYPQYLNIAVCMPSTSPANVRFDRAVWDTELDKL